MSWLALFLIQSYQINLHCVVPLGNLFANVHAPESRKRLPNESNRLPTDIDKLSNSGLLLACVGSQVLFNS